MLSCSLFEALDLTSGEMLRWKTVTGKVTRFDTEQWMASERFYKNVEHKKTLGDDF